MPYRTFVKRYENPICFYGSHVEFSKSFVELYGTSVELYGTSLEYYGTSIKYGRAALPPFLFIWDKKIIGKWTF
jgi:hypothetical protein